MLFFWSERDCYCRLLVTHLQTRGLCIRSVHGASIPFIGYVCHCVSCRVLLLKLDWCTVQNTTHAWHGGRFSPNRPACLSAISPPCASLISLKAYERRCTALALCLSLLCLQAHMQTQAHAQKNLTPSLDRSHQHHIFPGCLSENISRYDNM